MEHDHPTFNGYEVGDVTTERCPTCGGAMAFLYERQGFGYHLSCVVDSGTDHKRALTPQDIEG